MKNKSILVISLLAITVLFSSISYAEEPNKTRTEFKEKLAKMAGDLGPFARAEDFPKSYFLVPQNLPFMVGLALHHPKSKSLKLTDEQKKGINKIKKTTVPVVAKAGKKIKEKELALATAFIDGASVTDMEKLVDEISVLRTDLTKKHLVCIDQVRTILTSDQFKTLQNYASKKLK